MRLDRTQDPGLPMRRINWRLVVKVVGAIVVIMVLTFIVLVLTSGGYSTHG